MSQKWISKISKKSKIIKNMTHLDELLLAVPTADSTSPLDRQLLGLTAPSEAMSLFWLERSKCRLICLSVYFLRITAVTDCHAIRKQRTQYNQNEAT